MNIPNGLLEKLCCDYCKNYLSCGPIFLNYKTNKVSCGRCSPKKQSAITASNVRYSHYETLASILLFPCKYTKNGCPKKLLFSGENGHKHETTCEYKKRACPMSSSETEPHLKCKWIGRFATLLHHCKISHPDKVATNPCVLQHDFTEQMHDTHLITAFDSLFILNISIRNELIYNLHLIGTDSKARHFKYTLKIHTKPPKSIELIRDGVVSAETPPNRKSEPLIFLISDLIRIFQGISAIYFTLFIEKTSTKPKKRPVTVTAISCRFTTNGCTFSDVSPEKCKKHELYFCRYLTECPECNVNIERHSFVKHLMTSHNAFRAKNGKSWHIKEGYKQYCILTDDNDVFLCKYSLACYRLLLTVFSTFTTEQLKAFRCEVRINDPGNCYKHKLEPKSEFLCCYDWIININMYNYPMWNHYGLDLCVFITKNTNSEL